MEFYTAKVARHPALANPTVLLLTDRIDLDSQLYETFSASTLLPEQPQQALTRDKLRSQLHRPSGGILLFSRTKAEKEAGRRHPVLSARRNLVIVVDEAHRSHYDFIGWQRGVRRPRPRAEARTHRERAGVLRRGIEQRVSGTRDDER
jgi:type I restriction enzyme R subunit